MGGWSAGECAIGRTDGGKDPRPPAVRNQSGALHRACTISGSCTHNAVPAERGQKTRKQGVGIRKSSWRSARVDESDGLENRCGRKVTVGSNPTSSAKIS